MILEYAQLLSTAHRILDGTECVVLSERNRKTKVWALDDSRDGILYRSTHANHPSAIWVRQSAENYKWLYYLLTHLCHEYTYRYGKTHKVEASGLLATLYALPNRIPHGDFTEPTPAMPDHCKVVGDSLKSYHNYYIQEKSRMANWKNRPTPMWYKAA